jgi:hypothetical protein
MELSTVQVIKMAVSSTVGLSYDGLHVYVSLMVFFMIARILHKPLSSLTPWFAVLLIGVAGEVLDRRDDLNQLHHWRWEASLHDIVNTMFWPSVILLMARCGQYFKPENAIKEGKS